MIKVPFCVENEDVKVGDIVAENDHYIYVAIELPEKVTKNCTILCEAVIK